MDIVALFYGHYLLLIFLFTLFRIGGIMVFAPFFGSSNIIPEVKIGIAAITAFMLTPILASQAVALPENARDLDVMVITVIHELSVGLLIGFIASMFFASLQIAGQLVGLQMGFAIANVLDPQSEGQVSIIGQLFFFYGMVLFLIFGGHLFLLNSVIGSFDIIPIGGRDYMAGNYGDVMSSFIAGLTQLFTGVFVYALRFAAPVVVAVFLVTIALGFIARTVPQMNIMMVGFPLQIAIGMLFLVVSAPVFEQVFFEVYNLMGSAITEVLNFVGSGAAG